MKQLPIAATIAVLVTGAIIGATTSSPSAKESSPSTRACADKPVPAQYDAEAFAIDGDTLATVGGGPHVRIWGIQASELRNKKTNQETVAGMQGRAAMEDLLARAGWHVHIAPTKWDRYCRVVARVTMQGKVPWEGDHDQQIAGAATDPTVDLGRQMIERGMAYGFYLDDALKDDPHASVDYARAEAQARQKGVGLWPMWLGTAK